MKGIISKDTDAGFVVVDLIEDPESISACERCGLRDHCGLPDQKRLTFSRDELAGTFQAGEMVEVDVPPKIIILLSISVYVIPIFFMLVCAFLGARIGEWVSVVAGVGGLGFGLILNMILNRLIPISRIISVKKGC